MQRALHESDGNWTESDCSEARRSGALWSGQARVCRRQPAAMRHVAAAARVARATCLGAHAGERWNCSSVELAPRFTPDLLTGEPLAKKSAEVFFMPPFTPDLLTAWQFLLCYAATKYNRRWLTFLPSPLACWQPGSPGDGFLCRRGQRDGRCLPTGAVHLRRPSRTECGLFAYAEHFIYRFPGISTSLQSPEADKRFNYTHESEKRGVGRPRGGLMITLSGAFRRALHSRWQRDKPDRHCLRSERAKTLRAGPIGIPPLDCP
ncbi:unnamed protein product, partial [Iphiclides podalirius]